MSIMPKVMGPGAQLRLCPPITSSLGTHTTFGDLRAHLAQLPHFTAGDTEAPNHSPDSSGKQEALFSSYPRAETVHEHRHLHKHTRLQADLTAPKGTITTLTLQTRPGSRAGRLDSVALTASTMGYCVVSMWSLQSASGRRAMSHPIGTSLLAWGWPHQRPAMGFRMGALGHMTLVG